MNNAMIPQLIQYMTGFKGNPQQEVERLLRTGQMSNAQFQNLQTQANQMYSQLKGMGLIK